MATTTPTMAELLTAQYPPVISQTQLAQVFGQHVQTIRRLARAGRLPFPDVSISDAEKKYRLTDVIAYFENVPAQAQVQERRRGRPVGSRNKTHAR